MDSLQSQLQKTLGSSYTVERELDGGGMARVFVARDRTLERLVVIKTLATDSQSAISAERFRREVRLAASLQQANIVPVHTTGEVDGVPFYTMPYVEGYSLRDRLRKGGALPLREAVNILRDVARALAFAHERGVVHRDIKPENILLSGDTAMVTDFGIAKAIAESQSQPASTLTQLGTVLGTPAYLSPEQAAGEDGVDHRADIYSLGIVAYEVLAGAPPFTGKNAQALLAAHLTATPQPLGEHARAVPAPLAELVMRCLEKDPARRPATASELLRILDAGPVDHAPPTARAAVKPSIAVLPFANLSPDPADGFFADGLTDEIITDLAGVQAVHVIARTAMMRYKGVDKTPPEVARDLNVRYVLDGSVRRAGASLRLTARLVDTREDVTIWSDKITGVVDDIFDMQERVSRTIVDALRLKLSPAESERLAARQILDLRAYEAYLQARQAIWTFDPNLLDGALTLIGAARARTGENPRLLAAEALTHLSFIETGHDDAVPHLQAVARCADRLAALEPDSYSRYAVAGQLDWRRGHIREAISSLSRALELEPSAGDVCVYLAYAYLLAGQDARAREVADRLIEIDPLTPLFQVMPGFCETMAGHPEAAVPYYRRFAQIESTNPIAQFFHLVTLAETDDRDAAVAVADDLARRFPGTVFGDIAGMFADVGRERLNPSNIVVSSAMRAHSVRSDAFARPLAVLLARAGAADPAMDALEDSMRLGLAHYPYLARHSTAFAGIRELPRFRRLLEVVRVRWERGGTSAADLAVSPQPSTGALPTVDGESDLAQ